MMAEEFADLHKAIEKGDLESVKRTVESHGHERFFSFDQTSALYKSFQCKNYDIITFLIHKGAKFVGSEENNVYSFDINLDRVNHLLFDYNKKSGRSCVYRFMSLSQSPQVLDGERLNAIVSLYEHLFESKIVKCLMKVLECEAFDIVYDFESDQVNRVHRLYVKEAEIFGLTLSNSREIFIAAKNLLSRNPRMTGKVYGVVAEELCHLALTIVFENDAKPYSRRDSNLIQEFKDIILAVKSLADRTCHIESVITDVFAYPGYEWECELIARVPHVLGIYGEECGRRIFQECLELHSLFTFYDQNVLPKCRKYMDRSLNTKSDRIMKQLLGRNDFISFREKGISPLKEDFPSFREYLVVEEGVFVICTNCIKLCTLHVYHELKPVYRDQLERKCLFFDSECFEKKRDEILNALRCKLCDYLVLVLDDKELHHRRLLCEYLDHFEDFEGEGINLIIISNSQILGPEFADKFVEYKWEDLIDKYKDLRTWPLEYIFKGERKDISINKENVPELFSEEDIVKIMNGDIIEVQDGADLYSQGYNSKTYVERQFRATAIDRKLFEKIPADTCLFINGLCRWEFEELSINKRLVQWMEGPHEEIQKGKSIFINNKERPADFKVLVGKGAFKSSICLQYNRRVFYLMNSEGIVCKEHEQDMRFSEEEMIELLKNNKTLIISENAGSGKSTAMSSLISHVKKKIYNSWVLRVDLNKFSIKDDDHDSEENHEEEVFKDIYVMLGFKNGIEKVRFRETRNQKDYFIFLDAFDEIPSEHKSKALKLISFLREKTEARIMITTRVHHQQELEEKLNVFSSRLVPFDNLSQVNCLEKLWKWKLKFPNREGTLMKMKDKKAISRKINSIIREFAKEGTNSESHGLILALKKIHLEDSIDSFIEEIDCLEFKSLATSIIKKTLLDKETLDFMSIPLHLFLVGVIYFNGNFNMEIQSDIFSIYSKFIEQKILIYVEEKQGMLHDGRAKKTTIKKETENAYRIHFRLINQLMDDEKLEIDLNEEDLELCASLGIVFINGGKINFLHRTFAEFFIAEFIRLNMKKRVVCKLLFEDKFKVVRRFLSSALEKKTFENLEREIFEDVDFLVYVLEKFVRKFYFALFAPKGPVSCAAKIMRKLLETLDRTVSQDFLNRFFVELEQLFSRPHQWWHMIGGCLSVKMLKALCKRNIDRRMLLGMVRNYSDPDEVIDVLSECVSMDAAVENGRGAEEGGIKRKKNSLLKLFEIENSTGGLLEHALSNAKAEIFAKILKFSRDVLGKDRFIEEIVQRSEYEKRMKGFVTRGGIYRTCAILRKLHSAFGSEIETLYDTELKVKIISESIGYSPLWRFVFEEEEFEDVIGLFVRCFGSEDVKKVLLTGGSDGNYIIDKLSLCSDENRAKNLNVIINVLDDQDKVRKFLKSKSGDLRNFLHYAASRNSFGDIFRFCAANLEKDEIKAMLLSTDRHDENVLQSLVRNDEWETLIQNLNLIKDTVADVDWFKNFLREKDKNLRGLFHSTASHRNLGDLLQFCNAHLEKDELKEMLVSADRSGKDAWSSLPTFFFSEPFLRNLGLLKDVLADTKRFKEILKRKDKEARNLFHNSVLNENFGDVLQFCDGNLEKDEIKQMIVSADEKGTTALDLLLDINEMYSLEKLISTLNLIKDTVADDDWFKEFLKSGDVYAKLMTKVFVLTERTPRDNFADFLQFCNAKLENNEIQEMLTHADKYGRSSLHLLLENYHFGTLVEILGAVKDALDNWDWFRRFLMSTDGALRNAFHIAAFRSDFVDYLQFYGANLEKNDLKKLLISADRNGEDALHLLFAFSSTETVSRSLSLLKDILSDDEWFKEFLKRKDEYRRNIFHSAAENRNKIDFSFLSLYLDKREMVDLLVQRALPGTPLLHFVAASHPRNLPFWLDYSFGILKSQGSRFEQLLLATDGDGNGFLHLLYKTFPPYVFRVLNFDFKASANMIIKSLKEKLSEDVYKKLLRIRNYKGETFLQVESESKGKIVESFEGFIEKNLLEELLEPIEIVDLDPATLQYVQALVLLMKS